MEPMVELEVPEAVPVEGDGPFEVRGVARFHEELVRAQGFREALLESGRATRWSLDQDVAAAREWFAERGMNLGNAVVASAVLLTLAANRSRSGPHRGQLGVAAIDAIDRLHDTFAVPPSERQLKLFD